MLCFAEAHWLTYRLGGSGAKMRSKKDCLKDWPEPEQPGELDGAAGSQLFAETLSEEVGLSSRLKIQL